jgi:lipoprotein signal peptidase
MISVWIMSSYSEIAFLWFNVIGCFITIGVGLLISMTVKKNDE